MLGLLGQRPDIGVVTITWMFWIRLAFPLCLATASLLLTARLSRPGMRMGKAWAGVAGPVLAAWIAAIAILVLAAPGTRWPLVLGHSWSFCPFGITVLAVPAFISAFWAIKGLAPTRLRLAGAAGGLFAGSLGAIAYCLHCPEMAVTFWSVWYLLGMLIPCAIGAMLGPRWLRW
jgi:hypothetical protein